MIEPFLCLVLQAWPCSVAAIEALEEPEDLTKDHTLDSHNSVHERGK